MIEKFEKADGVLVYVPTLDFTKSNFIELSVVGPSSAVVRMSRDGGLTTDTGSRYYSVSMGTSIPTPTLVTAFDAFTVSATAPNASFFVGALQKPAGFSNYTLGITMLYDGNNSYRAGSYFAPDTEDAPNALVFTFPSATDIRCRIQEV